MCNVIKKMLIVVACYMCANFGIGGFAEIYEASVTTIQAENIFRYVANSNTLFVQDGNKIYQYNAESLDLAKQITAQYEILHIAAGNDGLYINEPGKIVLLDEEGMRLKEWELPTEIGDEVYQFYVTDKYLILLENITEHQFINYGTNVWYIDKDTKEYLRSQCATGVFAISNMPDDKILTLQTEDGQYSINIWDPDMDSAVNVAHVDLLPEAILADGSVGAYCLSGERLFYVDFAEGNVSDIFRIRSDIPLSCAGLERAGKRLITEDVGSCSMILLDLVEETEKTIALNLVNLSNYENQLSLAIDLFEEKYPNVYVQYSEMTEEKLSTLLLAQDPCIDILPVSSYNIDAYKENGVLIDLNQNDEIRDNLKNWRDFNGVISGDEPVHALPVFISVDALWGDASILREYGIDTENFDPAQMTWNEFYEFCVQLLREYGVITYAESSRFPLPVKQYIAAFKGEVDTINFQTEEFYSIVRMVKERCEEGILPFTKMPISEDNVIDYSNVSGASQWDTGSEKILLLPMLGGENAYPALMDMIGVNARSENRELALEFLAILTSPEVQGKDYMAAMLSDSTLYDEEFLKDNGCNITSESLETWDRACRSLGSIGLIQGEFGKYLGDQMESYLRGDIDEFELARSLDERMNMIRMG